MAGNHALGRVEYWKDGIMGGDHMKNVIQNGFQCFQPFFQYSNIPSFRAVFERATLVES
jgi:hypothetical protein